MAALGMRGGHIIAPTDGYECKEARGGCVGTGVRSRSVPWVQEEQLHILLCRNLKQMSYSEWNRNTHTHTYTKKKNVTEIFKLQRAWRQSDEGTKGACLCVQNKHKSKKI